MHRGPGESSCPHFGLLWLNQFPPTKIFRWWMVNWDLRKSWKSTMTKLPVQNKKLKSLAVNWRRRAYLPNKILAHKNYTPACLPQTPKIQTPEFFQQPRCSSPLHSTQSQNSKPHFFFNIQDVAHLSIAPACSPPQLPLPLSRSPGPATHQPPGKALPVDRPTNQHHS